MDANATLRRMRELVREITDESTSPDEFILASFALAEHVENLDEWLSRGGFLPADWRR